MGGSRKPAKLAGGCPLELEHSVRKPAFIPFLYALPGLATKREDRPLISQTHGNVRNEEAPLFFDRLNLRPRKEERRASEPKRKEYGEAKPALVDDDEQASTIANREAPCSQGAGHEAKLLATYRRCSSKVGRQHRPASCT